MERYRQFYETENSIYNPPQEIQLNGFDKKGN